MGWHICSDPAVHVVSLHCAGWVSQHQSAICINAHFLKRYLCGWLHSYCTTRAFNQCSNYLWCKRECSYCSCSMTWLSSWLISTETQQCRVQTWYLVRSVRQGAPPLTCTACAFYRVLNQSNTLCRLLKGRWRCLGATGGRLLYHHAKICHIVIVLHKMMSLNLSQTMLLPCN